MFRSSIRCTVGIDANAETSSQSQSESIDGAGHERALRPVEPAPLDAEHEERGERDDAEIEIELGEVLEHPLRHLADGVVLVAVVW